MKGLISFMLLAHMIPMIASSTADGSHLNPTFADELRNTSIVSDIRFQENRGQFVDADGKPLPDVRYVARVPGARIYIRDHGISYVFLRGQSEQLSAAKTQEAPSHLCFMEFRDMPPYDVCRLDMILEGSSPDARIRASKPFEGHVNYYLAHCPNGITGIREYGCVVYENIYPNIDLQLLSIGGRMKYNFVVHPGGDPRRIAMRYAGATDAALSHAGALSVSAPIGCIEEAAPYTYSDDEKNAVASRFVVEGKTVSFEVGEYDPSTTLVIDPWATYFGSSGQEYCQDVATDAQGNAFLVGYSAGGTLTITIGSSNPGGYTTFIDRF